MFSSITGRFVLISTLTALILSLLLAAYYYQKHRQRAYARLETLGHSKIDMLNFAIDSLFRAEQELRLPAHRRERRFRIRRKYDCRHRFGRDHYCALQIRSD